MPTETFTTPGNNSWVCPENTFSGLAECHGGGGAGVAPSLDSYGGGGGGGAYSKKTVSLTPGVTYTVRVGAGGNAAGLIAEGAGGDSWFSTSGTVLAKGGDRGNDGENTNGFGGAAASGIGDVKYSGGDGAYPGGIGGGGGGSSAGTAANGNAATTATGATAPTGGGAGGSGSSAGTATAGAAPGGGGGGTSSGTPANGAAGKVVLTYTVTTPSSTVPVAGRRSRYRVRI